MKTFDNLFVIGRPAGGKSEFIDFMKKLPDDARAKEFHIGKFKEIDDFPWLWQTFMDDDARAARGEARLYTEMTDDGHVLKMPKYREGLIPNFNKEIEKKYLSNPSFYKDGTLMIEFARGKTDGFKGSLEKFDPRILKSASILYISVSFEECVRRNNARYKKELAHSILSHKVAERDMHEYFIENDWDAITSGKSHGLLNLSGIDVPFVSMNNEPESADPKVLGPRYGSALDLLWENWCQARQT